MQNKQLYSLIFLLSICLSMPLGAAASDSRTLQVQPGQSSIYHEFGLVLCPSEESDCHPIAGALTWSLSPNNGTATLSYSSEADGQGRASFTLTFGANACGTYIVTVGLTRDDRREFDPKFIISGKPPCSTGLSSEATEPTKLFIVSGYDQTGIVGQPLAAPFVVRVRDRDQDNKPLEGVKVTFTVLTGGGSLSTTTGITDTSGLAKSTLTLGAEPGTNTVEVRAEGVSKEVVFSAEGILSSPVPTMLSIISGDSQTGLTGESLSSPFIVEVRDQRGDPMEGVTVSFAVTGDDGSLSAMTAITDANGQASSTLRLGTEAGANRVEANVEGISEPVIFGAEATLPPPVPTMLSIISGDSQTGLTGESLANPFVVEVRDQRGDPMGDVTVSFAVTGGDGSLSATTAITDANGQAKTTLTLGTDPGAATVEISVKGIAQAVTFSAVAELLEFDLSLSAGFNLIHLPLKVRAVNGMPSTIQSVSDLYDALGGADTVHWLTTHDSYTQTWYSYFGDADRGRTADRELTDQTGLLASMIAPVSVRLGGDALGTDGRSTLTLSPGSNLVGLPLGDARITRVSDLLTLDGLDGNVLAVIIADGGEFKVVGRAGDPGDIAVGGGQGFIISVQRGAEVSIAGDAWSDNSEGF